MMFCVLSSMGTSTSGFVQFVVVFILFIIILVMTYFTTRFVGGFQRGKYKTGNIKVLEALRISNNKSIQIIEVGEKCFAVAVCKDSVTFLGEIDKNDINIDENVVNMDSFNVLFNRLKKQNQNHDFDSEEEDRK